MKDSHAFVVVSGPVEVLFLSQSRSGFCPFSMASLSILRIRVVNPLAHWEFQRIVWWEFRSKTDSEQEKSKTKMEKNNKQDRKRGKDEEVKRLRERRKQLRDNISIYLYIYISISIYIYAVELITGPRFGIFKVNNWATFAFYKKLFFKKHYKNRGFSRFF